MYPRAFSYVRAHSQEEAVAALAEHGPDAVPLAGGMSLVPQMKYRERNPAVVVDVGWLRELAGVTVEERRLRIGATTRHHEAAAWRGPRELAIVAELAAGIGDPQVRTMGTVGGSIAAVEPAGDWGPAVLALRGAVRVASARGERTIAADELFLGPRRTSLAADELIVEIEAPLPSSPFATAQVRFQARAAAGFMSCASCVALDDAGGIAEVGIACGGLEEIPVRLDEAEAAVRGAGTPGSAGRAAADRIPSGPRDGNGFRRTVAARLVHDAVERALERALAIKEAAG
jgi:carbon-monoxide dehydrogenase medium subunit